MNRIARKLNSLAQKSGRALSAQKGRGVLHELASDLAFTFLAALNNVNYDIRNNGEFRVMRIMSEFRPRVVVDVGANVGDWSAMALECFPDARVHAFEIVPETFGTLSKRFAGNPRISLNPVGLSDAPGKVRMSISKDTSLDATACAIEGMPFHQVHYSRFVECPVTTGREYVEQNGIGSIDFLKVDVEGLDLKVLRGFEDHLAKARLIQFEYGIFNIASHDLLHDFWKHLQLHGFAVGKIFPRSVEFFEYDARRDDLLGNNFVAVKRNDTELLERLRTYAR